MGAARRLPRYARARALDRGPSAGRRTELRGAPGRSLFRGWQRDSNRDRPLARSPADRALHRASLRGCQERGWRCPRHLRQLPEHRVPRASLPRPRRLQRLPRGRRPVRRLRGQAAERRRRPAADYDRARARQPPPRRGRSGPPALVADPLGVCGRVRRRVRLRVDGRVEPWRPRRRRLELRADARRPPSEAGARSRGARVRTCAGRTSRFLAPDFGRRLHAQRGIDAGGCARGSARAGLPQLRDDRRRRRVDRLHARDRITVRRTADPKRTTWPRLGSQSRFYGRNRRDRRVPGRRRPPRPALAGVPGFGVSGG